MRLGIGCGLESNRCAVACLAVAMGCIDGSRPGGVPNVPRARGQAVAGPTASPVLSAPAPELEGHDSGPWQAAEPDDDPGPAAWVVVERPYKLFERPRPSGAVEAAVLDEELARWNVGGTGDPEFLSNRPTYHPGARVVVELKTRSRALEHRYLAQARRRGYWPFRLCFEEGLRQDQKLHGKTEVRLALDRTGRARGARLVGKRLGDLSVAECLAERASELVFSPPPPHRIEVEMTIGLWPGDAPVPSVGPAHGTTATNPDTLDQGPLMGILDGAKPDLERCYHRGLERDARLWGRIELRLEQDEAGRLERIEEHQSHFPDRRMALCVVETLRTLPWPKPHGGRLSWVVGLRFGRLPELRNEYP